MIFFLLHHIFQAFFGKLNADHQTTNLLTFLIGGFMWCILYVATTTDGYLPHGLLRQSLGFGFPYLLVSDLFAMAIIYKNYWKTSILTEITDSFAPKESTSLTKDGTQPSSTSQTLYQSETAP
jgi:hypothetical protein